MGLAWPILGQIVGSFKFVLFLYIKIHDTYITTYLDTIIHNKKLGKFSKHPLVLGELHLHQCPILAVVSTPLQPQAWTSIHLHQQSPLCLLGVNQMFAHQIDWWCWAIGGIEYSCGRPYMQPPSRCDCWWPSVSLHPQCWSSCRAFCS